MHSKALVSNTKYEHTKAKSLILSGPNSNSNPKEIFGIGIYVKAFFFVKVMVE